jgi:hypothetical protein
VSGQVVRFHRASGQPGALTSAVPTHR